MHLSRPYSMQWLLWMVIVFLPGTVLAEDGYELWLRYNRIPDPELLSYYKKHATEMVVQQSCPIFRTVQDELLMALQGLLGQELPVNPSVSKKGAIILGTLDESPILRRLVQPLEMEIAGDEGYIIRSLSFDNRPVTVIAANKSKGVLYGVFRFICLIQNRQAIDRLSIRSKPRIQRRLLNHWDNLNGSVERGYAGKSIWNWEKLPAEIDSRYEDYARANASIGINGTVMNNVNSQAEILTKGYISKAAAIANVLRPYGIRVYFSVKFTSPMEIGGLSTADPFDPGVRRWWKERVRQIYEQIPDFGGFLVKAYSEGQPGPQIYGRTHADGANMLAEALSPFEGIVMWRSFVYDLSIDSDRAKCGYLEFVPLDGQFAANVLIQSKNGPVDFQPREPFNPLFGAMQKTPLMMELQITQEYTGQGKHLVYLAPQWKEVLDSETFAKGSGTLVAGIVDGSAENHALSGIAGVSGIGTDRNWMGHHFSQANWYAFGRLAWDPALTSEQIAEEWIEMTWSNDPETIDAIMKMMAGSWEACVDYMTPLGLHHLMAAGHHYGPEPEYVNPDRADWSSTYYHKADSEGIGFDRSSAGTNAVNQYAGPLRKLWDSPATCPEKYLLWFHHLPWTHQMSSGKTLWQELQLRYNRGVESVMTMQKAWDSLEGKIDEERFEHVKARLEMQLENAQEWRDVCLDYFGRFAESPDTRDGE
ncbi:MAG: alpha-glucuronidase [Deltaproteobacteria bacterium]|nr:alpha-glucuronidase [Deltaproteobacteria bacterium]